MKKIELIVCCDDGTWKVPDFKFEIADDMHSRKNVDEIADLFGAKLFRDSVYIGVFNWEPKV